MIKPEPFLNTFSNNFVLTLLSFVNNPYKIPACTHISGRRTEAPHTHTHPEQVACVYSHHFSVCFFPHALISRFIIFTPAE